MNIITSILFLSALVNSLTRAQNPPKFHCYTMTNYPVMAFQRPTQCGDEKVGMEVVCNYSAGCMPSVAAYKTPPTKTDAELLEMFNRQELKTSFLICKARRSAVKDGNVVSAECPPLDECLSEGLYSGVPLAYLPTIVPVVAPNSKEGANGVN